MPFKPTLFAPEEEATASPYLGHPITSIVLEQDNGAGAALPALPSPDDRSRIAENTIGGDIKVDRAKRVEIEFEIDYISAEKKAEIERLFHDGRDVYICPNRDVDTRVCLPLMRDAAETTGRRLMTVTQAGVASHWDQVDQVMRSFSVGGGTFPFHGSWSRYFTTGIGSDNKSPQPAPDSGGHGMTINTGTITFIYTESVLTPVLARRGITNGRGVLNVQADTTTGICEFRHQSTFAISPGSNVTGSILIQFSGIIEFDLRNHGGSVTYDTKIIQGDGRWQLVKLSGANSNATNNTEIGVKFLQSATRRQQANVAAVHLGNDSGALTGEVFGDDWSQGGIDPGYISNTDLVELWAPLMTISFFAKYSAGRCGFFEMGAGPSIFCYKDGGDTLRLGVSDSAGASAEIQYANLGSSQGLVEGDWYHVVFVLGSLNSKIYINGRHTGITAGPFESYNPGNQLRIGNVFGGSFLPNSGISHFRVDAREWTASEVEDHFDTYFAPAGRGIIEPAFGRLGYISEIDFSGARMGSGNAQFTGSIVWTELEVEATAPMQEQEGNV